MLLGRKYFTWQKLLRQAFEVKENFKLFYFKGNFSQLFLYKYLCPLPLAWLSKTLTACCVSRRSRASLTHSLATLRGAPCRRFMYFSDCTRFPRSIQYLLMVTVRLRQTSSWLINSPCTIKNIVSIQFTEVEFLIVKLVLWNDFRWPCNQSCLDERQQVHWKRSTFGWNQSQSSSYFCHIHESFAQSLFGENSSFSCCLRKRVEHNSNEFVAFSRRSDSSDFALQRTKLLTPRFSRLTLTDTWPESLTCSPEGLCLISTFLSVSTLYKGKEI